METRKVYISGGSTYVLSLPKKWVNKTGLKAGDSLVVTEQGGSLLIETGDVEKEPKVKEIRISQLTSSESLPRMIIAYYLVGYDTLKIILNSKDHLSYRKNIRKILDFLVGVEIVEDTNEAMTLEIMVDYKRMMTAQILQRMYSIIRSMLLDMGKAMENMDTALAKDVIVREREVDRLYFLVVRQLKSAVEYQQVAEKLGIKNQKDCLGYRIAVKVLERISDHIENIANSYIELLETGDEVRFEDFIKLNNRIVVIFEKAFNSLFTRNYIMAETIFQNINEIKNTGPDFTNQLLSPKNIQSAILMKAMLDSLERIESYSSDLAEIAINMSAGNFPGKQE
ncbi:MAG: phosphate uptake regulator PhoU [Candidatus Methanoperedenaceae archaeon]|nr:phosphate uptake regulator PhoU [Candidatus Methanoperedenaceae archaeon]